MFGGIKLEKITVQKMVRFYVVMIHMRIETRHLGGYEGYFIPTKYARVGHGYNVNIVGYVGWSERIMNLALFCHIRSASHPEAGKYSDDENFHKIMYLIRSVNDTARNTFELGSKNNFYARGISTRTPFYCVRQ